MMRILSKITFFLLLFACSEVVYALPKGNAYGNIEITATGTGYTASIGRDSTFTSKSLYDILLMLPEITSVSESFRINGNPASGVYINESKITEHSALKSISVSGNGSISVSVTYAAAGDSSSDSDGGKIKIYVSPEQERKLSGILSAGSTFRPGDGFRNADVLSALFYRKTGFSLSNTLRFSEETANGRMSEKRYGNDTVTTGSRTEGWKRHISEKLMIDKSFGERHTVSFSGGFIYDLNAPKTLSSYNGNTDAGTVTSNHIDHIEYNAKADYTAAIDKDRIYSSVSFSYTGKDEDRRNRYINKADNLSAGDLSRIHTDVFESSVSFRFLFSELFNLNAGAEFDAVLSEYTLVDSYGESAFDENVSSASTKGYTSRIFALATGSYKGMEYRAGLNLQSNTISYQDHTYGLNATNTKFGINPTVKLLYNLGKKKRNHISLTYRHSLGNIPYRAITPYRYWSDKFNYTTGNPALKSPQADIAMLIFSLNGSGFNIGFTYRHDRDQIYFKTFDDPDMEGVTYTQPVNIGNSHSTSLNAEANIKAGKWLKSKFHVSAEILKENSPVDGIMYNNYNPRFYISLNNSFSFGSGFGAVLNGEWQSGYRYYDKWHSDIYTVWGSLYKFFPKEKLRISIDFTAFANSIGTVTEGLGYSIISDDLTERRYIGISASWNF